MIGPAERVGPHLNPDDATEARAVPVDAETTTALEATALDDAVPGPARTPIAAAPGAMAWPTDQTEVIPRMHPDPLPPRRHQSLWPADHDYVPSDSDEPGSRTEPEQSETEHPLTAYSSTDHTSTELGAAGDEDSSADAAIHRRRGTWVWAGLAGFWLLALGAGVISLASLGAPHYLCTGSAAKGLACRNTGTVIAALLTVLLIAVVGSVSVLVVEARTKGATAARRLGIGMICLVVIAVCGYLLIRTIGG